MIGEMPFVRTAFRPSLPIQTWSARYDRRICPCETSSSSAPVHPACRLRLPRSGAILFTIRRGDRSPWDQAEIAIYSTQTHTYRVVVTGGADARYVATGSQEFLVFVRDGVLMAAPFDVATSAVTAEARPVGNVMQAAYATLFGDDSGAGEFSVSDTGTLVYIPGGVFPEREDALVLVDQTGQARDLNLPRRTLFGPRAEESLSLEVEVTEEPRGVVAHAS